ncbi:MAG TPA: hypothetical protein VNU68_25575 [Verrucomicrobiae bacterium]|nr:hypothetical protein [Verrucomicrobiae bacterium]
MKYFFPEPADTSERALFAGIEKWDGPRRLDQFTPELLRELTERAGCDFASALLHRRIVESDQHGPFLRALAEQADPKGLDGTVAIVPGAFYRENPRTGADGRVVQEVAAQVGLPFVVTPVASTGSLEENARLLRGWLSQSDCKRLILVSVSKGGGDVKTALARPDAAQVFERVAAWVNLCGILDGTPMADWLLSPNLFARANRFVYRIRGRSLDFLRDLRRFPGCTLDFPLTLPAHLQAVHVVGFPLRRHLHNGLARRCHARLEAFGPNDGSILLSDAPRWPGQLCPVWGADHYLRPREDVRPLLAALLRHFAR